MKHSQKGWIGALAASVVALHAAGWGLFVLSFAGGESRGVGLGLAFTAYTLGLRHGFDADHIAAIDNTARRLMAMGIRPWAVGFFFSLGHASVVMGLTLGLALTAKVGHGSSAAGFGGLVGTLLSAGVLYILAGLNLVVLRRALSAFGRLRSGRADGDAGSDSLDAKGGLMFRLCRRATTAVTSPWQMFPVGVLFGLGFETATEVALLAVTAQASATSIPWYAILCLPLLFGAGMCLVDTSDGCVMVAAYGWALHQRTRRLYYNIIVTALSVVVALAIGSIELLGLLVSRAGLHGGLWDLVSGFNINEAGVAVVVLFVATWLISVVVWKLRRFEISPPQATAP